MKELIIILFAAILTENFVLNQFLGICPFLGVSKKMDAAVGMSIAVTFVMVMATAVTFPIYTYILQPRELQYMQTIVFILIIAALVQLVEMVLKKFIPALHKGMGIYLPLITTNCAVLGVTVLNIDKGFAELGPTIFGNLGAWSGFLLAIINSLGAGLGFLLAMVLFCGVRSRVDAADIPESFKGIPITLIAAAIISVSFMGFTGLVEGIFQ